MTLDERLEAMRMNLELQMHEIEALRIASSHHDGQVKGLVIATGNLLKVSEGHERRLTRLESR